METNILRKFSMKPLKKGVGFGLVVGLHSGFKSEAVAIGA